MKKITLLAVALMAIASCSDKEDPKTEVVEDIEIIDTTSDDGNVEDVLVEEGSEDEHADHQPETDDVEGSDVESAIKNTGVSK